MRRRSNWTSSLLWAIYLALLLVLLPHTAWAFGRFEPSDIGWLGIRWGVFSACAAAFAFEAAIAALTHKLALHIETTPRYSSGNKALRRFNYQYLNAYAAGLLVALVVSALANFGHAVEYGQSFAIYGEYGFSPLLYSLTFGGILPLVSLLFARILANTDQDEAEVNVELARSKHIIDHRREDLKAAEENIGLAEAKAMEAERRFEAAGDTMARLFAEEKRQRILAAAGRWPQLPASSIAIISESSPSYVSEVLNSSNGK